MRQPHRRSQPVTSLSPAATLPRPDRTHGRRWGDSRRTVGQPLPPLVVFGVVAPPTSPSVCWLPRVRTPAGTDIHRIPFLEVVSDFQARLPLPSHVNSDFLITHSNKVIVDVHAKTAAFLTSSEAIFPRDLQAPSSLRLATGA